VAKRTFEPPRAARTRLGPWWRLWRDQRGFLTITVALLLTAFIGFVGLAVETGLWYAVKRQNQSAADEAALSGAMELIAGKSYQTGICALAEYGAERNGFIFNAFACPAASPGCTSPSSGQMCANNPPVLGAYAGNSDAVEVILSNQLNTLFASLLLLPSVTIDTRAVALVNSAGSCVISLAPTGQDGVLASGAAVVNAQSCNLYDNSSDPKALEASGSAKIEVKNAYIAGKYNATLVTSSSCPGSGILCVPSPGVAKTSATMPSPLDPYCNYPTDTPPACANRTTPTEAACPAAGPTQNLPRNDPTNPNFTVYNNGNWGQFYLTTAAASATGSTTLTFSAAAIQGLVVGMQVSQDVTTNNAINGNPTITAVNTVNDTVTISKQVQSPGVGNGDTIKFQIPSTLPNGQSLVITIYPGTYCGNIQPGGPLTLNPGVYVLAGGSFDDGGGSSSDPVLTNGLCTSPDGKPYVNASGVTVYLGPPKPTAKATITAVSTYRVASA
jgi:Putative Flp pilus-assembly TadE/G-like